MGFSVQENYNTASNCCLLQFVLNETTSALSYFYKQFGLFALLHLMLLSKPVHIKLTATQGVIIEGRERLSRNQFNKSVTLGLGLRLKKKQRTKKTK